MPESFPEPSRDAEPDPESLPGSGSDLGPTYADGEPTEALINASIRGDLEAWGRLTEPHRNVLVFLAGVRVPSDLRPKFDTFDVFQSAMLHALRSLRNYEYRGKGSFTNWLTKVLQFKFKNRLRKHRGQRTSPPEENPLDSGVLADVGAATSRTPEQIAEDAEYHAILIQEIAALTQEEQLLIRWKCIDGETLDAIAKRMDKTPQALGRILAKALDTLQCRLNQREHPSPPPDHRN